jgi:hypothetical protein
LPSSPATFQRRPPVAGDAGAVAQRLAEALAEHEPDVLDGVVAVDLDVAARRDRQVEQAVAGHGVEHVGQERDRRVELPETRAVDAQLDGDLGLLGVALDARAPRGHVPF